MLRYRLSSKRSVKCSVFRGASFSLSLSPSIVLSFTLIGAFRGAQAFPVRAVSWGNQAMASWTLFLKYWGRAWWSCTYDHSLLPTQPRLSADFFLSPCLMPFTRVAGQTIVLSLHLSVLLETSSTLFSCSLHHFSPLYTSPDLFYQLFVITVIWTTCWWPPTHQTQMTSFPLYKSLNCFQVLSMTVFCGWPLGSKTLVLATHLNH